MNLQCVTKLYSPLWHVTPDYAALAIGKAPLCAGHGRKIAFVRERT